MQTRGKKKNNNLPNKLVHAISTAVSSFKKPRSRFPNSTSSFHSMRKSAHSSCCLISVPPDYQRCKKSRKRSAPDVDVSEVFRRITRQQSRNREEEKERKRVCGRRSEIEVSESSCVESTSVRGIDGSGFSDGCRARRECSDEISRSGGTSVAARFDNRVCLSNLGLRIDAVEKDLNADCVSSGVFLSDGGSRIQTFGSTAKQSKSKAEESEGIGNSEITSLFPFTNRKTSRNKRKNSEFDVNSDSSAFNFSNCQRSGSTKQSKTHAEESEGISRSEISSLDHFINPETSATVEIEIDEESKNNQNSTRNRELDDLNPSYSAFKSRNEAAIHSIHSNSTINNDQNTTEAISEPSICCFSVNSSANKDIFGSDSDLICTERLSSSSCSSIDSRISEYLNENSSSDYSPSIWLNSGSDFSDKSSDDFNPSPTFSLFLHYSKQFSSSVTPKQSTGKVIEEDEEFRDYQILRFDDEEDEESYQRLRSRERREECIHNYGDGEFYREIDEFADLIIQVRFQLVCWIIQQSSIKELQDETMFLGVNLLDRFFSKGFFKCKRSNQIVGIACLVLATRIEENQPYNSVRQKTFSMGENVYSRCEVVAMEWLVQRVLNFRCFFPTIHNFLWYYLKAAKADMEVERRARYLAMLALLDHKQLDFWPSTVAAGLVILSSLASHYDSSCFLVMQIHARTKNDDLECCIKGLGWMVNHVC